MSLKFFAEIEAKKRNLDTGSFLKKLRNDNSIPAVVYGKKIKEPIFISVNHLSLLNRFKADPSSLVRIFKLSIKDGVSYNVVIKEVQFHPVKNTISHIDFCAVEPDSVLEFKLPIKILNKEQCPGVKRGGDVFMFHYNVKVKGPVKDLPDSIHIDVSNSEIGDKFYTRDLKLPSSFKFMTDTMIVKVAGKRVNDSEPTKEQQAEAPKTSTQTK